MKRKLHLVLLILITILFFWSINSCKKDESAVGTDKELFDMAKSATGFSWYKNSDGLLDKSSGSGHSQPFLRVRYNSVAAAKLGSDGRVIAGTVFPEGSLIVKELYDNSTSIGLYAILSKQSKNANADAKGWVWGYINSDGTTAEPSSNKGTACILCHEQQGNIDYTLMNKFFP